MAATKSPKSKYLLADDLAHNCDILVSIGGVQSNHTRQVAAVAARSGLKAKPFQEHWEEWEDAGFYPSGCGLEHKSTDIEA